MIVVFHLVSTVVRQQIPNVFFIICLEQMRYKCLFGLIIEYLYFIIDSVATKNKNTTTGQYEG